MSFFWNLIKNRGCTLKSLVFYNWRKMVWSSKIVFFLNYDTSTVLVKATRPRLFQLLRRAYAASYNENLNVLNEHDYMFRRIKLLAYRSCNIKQYFYWELLKTARIQANTSVCLKFSVFYKFVLCVLVGIIKNLIYR